jgi:hypothetical protein
MWPFSEMSLATASLVGTIANWILLASLVGGVLSTFVIVKTSDIKEEHWAEDRIKSNERIAKLNNETASLTADNLALQTVLLPRHVGLIGLDEQPKALTWFVGFERWAGTKILIQVIPGDPEARNLANEIAIVLSKFGWIPEFVDDKRSGMSLNLREGVQVYSPGSYKAYDPNSETQKVFRTLGDAARALAMALTNAGLGVGSYPVSGTHGSNIIVDFPQGSEGDEHNPFRDFSPQLDGVYLQVGSRPIASTMEWIGRGRPDAAGNVASDTTSAEQPK